MGLFGFGKKKEEKPIEPLPEILSPDSSIDSLASEPHDFTENMPAQDELAPQPLPPNISTTQNEESKLPMDIDKPSESTKTSKESSGADEVSFEIPDFGDDEINVDVHPEDMVEEPHVSLDEPEEDTDFTKEVDKEEDSDLPKFELSKPKSPEIVITKKEIPKFDDAPTTIKQTVVREVFVKKHEYIDVLSREEEVTSEIKRIKTDLNRLLSYATEEEKIYGSMSEIATKIKDELLTTDSKLFER